MSRVEFIGYLGHDAGPGSKEYCVGRVRLQNNPCFKAEYRVTLRPIVRVRIFRYLAVEYPVSGYSKVTRETVKDSTVSKLMAALGEEERIDDQIENEEARYALAKTIIFTSSGSWLCANSYEEILETLKAANQICVAAPATPTRAAA
jgi:DNA-binding transcriptional ArsR family regulator